jgi:hypothetical protein
MKKLIVAALALVTVGCANQANPAANNSSAPSPTTTTSAAADRNKVSFMGDLCGAAAKFLVPALSVKPDTSSQAATVKSLTQQLGAMSKGVDDATADLKNVDTTKVPDGQLVIDDMQKAFGQIKATVDGARQKLAAVDPNDQQAVSAAVQDASKSLSGFGSMQNPLDQPHLRSADMEQAAAQSPKCQQVKDAVAGGVASATSTS